VKIDRAIKRVLDETGMPYEFVKGGKHIVVRLNGRHAGILPYGITTGGSRAVKNHIAHIRKIAAGHLHATRAGLFGAKARDISALQ
jgi:hypothetical protein